MRRRILYFTAAVAAALTTVLGTATPLAGAWNAREGEPPGHERRADAQHDGPATAGSDDDAEVPDPQGDSDNLHPSGNDRHEAHAQGRSPSAPDEDGHGPERDQNGTDKSGDPDGSGGIDLADQDGNNGCGNDDDFEDDNEGLCGPRVRPAPTQEVTPAASVPASASAAPVERARSVVLTSEPVTASALAAEAQAVALTPVLAEPQVPSEPHVLGVAYERTPASSLATTGGGALVPLALTALGALVTGGLLTSLRRGD